MAIENIKIQQLIHKQNFAYFVLLVVGIGIMFIGIFHLITAVQRPNDIVFSYKEYISHPSYAKIAALAGSVQGYTDVIVGVENDTQANYTLVYKNFGLQTGGTTYYPTLISTSSNSFIIPAGEKAIVTLIFPINGITAHATMTIKGNQTPIVIKQ